MAKSSMLESTAVPFQGVLDALVSPIVVIDRHALISAVNKAWEQTFPNKTAQGFVGENYLHLCQLIHGQDEKNSELCRQGIQDVLAGRRSTFRFDYRHVETGKNQWFQMQVTPLAEPFQGAVVSHTDTTESWQTDAQMTMLLESPIDALMIVDEHGLIQMVNSHLESMFGYSRNELFGQTLDILIPHRFRRQHRQHQSSYMSNPHNRPMGNGLELLGLRKDGTEFPVEISLNPLESAGTKLVSAAIRDVSERKRAEMQLQRLARILETSASEIYLFDAHSLCFTFVNQGARENLGYTLQELSSLTPLDLKPEFKLTTFQTLLQPLRDGQKETIHFMAQHQRKNGSRYPVDVTLQLFTNETPPVFAAIIVDTSEREAAQHALQESQQRLTMHVAHTPLAVLEWQVSDGRLTLWNTAAETIFGYRAEEVIGKETVQFIFPEEVREAIKKVFSGEGTIGSGIRQTYKNQGRNGRTLSCEWYITPLESGEGKRLAALVLDVTTRQRALNKLVSAQEEASARIARDLHDQVGQSLTGLMLGLTTAPEQPTTEQLEGLRTLTNTILQDVRRISRELRPALLDELGLEAALKGMARELSEQSSVRIDVLVRLPEGLGHDEVTVLYRVAQEALTNVVRHAKAKHASVTVTTSDDEVQLVIEDDGVGFDVNAASSVRHVGLSSMRERLELFGGTFTTESQSGQGTTISARLPFGQ